MPRFRGISVRVSARGINRVKANLQAIDKKIPNAASATIKKAVEAGKKFAQAIAPKDTGALIRAIHFGTKGTGPRRVGWVRSEQPDHPVKGKSVPYHLFMHVRPTQFDYGGDPQYMYTTAAFLKKNFPAQMKRAVSAVLKTQRASINVSEGATG